MKGATVNGHRRTADPYFRLQRDMAALRRDVTGLLTSRAGSAAAKTGEALSAAAEQAKATYNDGRKVLTKAAGKRPLTTAALSLAVGALTGAALALMCRKGSATDAHPDRAFRRQR